MQEAGIRHPFLNHDWICTWWECFGPGRELYVILVMLNGVLRGIAPLMLSRKSIYGLRGVRSLGFLYNPHTPRCDFIVPHGAEDIYHAIWTHIRRNEREWDALELCRLPDDSKTLHEIRKYAGVDGLLTGIWQGDPSPYVIGQPWKDYSEKLHRSHQQNLTRRFKSLSKLGHVELEVVTSTDDLEKALEDAFHIEAAAWKGKAGTAIEEDARTRQFYTRLVERAARRGWLHLSFLTINRRRIVARIGLRYANRHYLLKSGYDPEFSKYSPSILHFSLLLRDILDQGMSECDLLGGNDEWKLRWTQLVRPHWWLFVFPKSLQGTYLHSIKFRLAPGLNRWRAGVASFRNNTVKHLESRNAR